MKFKEVFKTIHWLLLIFIIVLYTLLKINSSDNDNIRKTIDVLTISVLTIWGGTIAVLTLKNGDKEKVVGNAIKSYQALLNKNWLLIIVNLALVTILCIFTYLLVFFRQIEFMSDSKVELFINDDIGKIEKIGVVEPNSINTFRIKIGERNFYFEEINGNRKGALLPIKINFFWQAQPQKRLTLKLENEYENLN